MAVYKSSHKGSQIDEAVTIANGNYNKGSDERPIYYDANGVAQPVNTSGTVTVSSTEMLTSGGAYDGLAGVLSNNDIQNSSFEGNFTKVGNVSIVDGVASGFTSNNYLYKNLSVTVSQELSYHLKFTTGADVDTFQFVMWNNGGVNSVAITGGNCRFRYVNSGGVTFPVSSNTTYYVIMQWLNGSWYFKYSIDGINYTSLTSASGTVAYTHVNITFSQRSDTNANSFLGFIDLNDFKVYIDNELIYTPYPIPELPPSQNLTKTYVDGEVAKKQSTITVGYGIDLNDDTISLSSSILKNSDNRSGSKISAFQEYELGNNTEVLCKLDDAKHSTFDIGKFEVVANGSTVSSPSVPFNQNGLVISSDGIMTGTSYTNYVVATVPTSNYMEYVFSFVQITDPTTFANSVATFSIGLDDGTNHNMIYGEMSHNDGSFIVIIRNGDTYTAIVGINQFKPILGVEYIVKMVVDKTHEKFYFKYKEKGAEGFITVEADLPANITTYVDYSKFMMGSVPHSSSNPRVSQMDLKQVEIFVDNEPVFNGNVTGIDIIKSDNWILPSGVTSPTISDEGIASGFKGTKYIQSPALDVSGNFVIRGTFKADPNISYTFSCILSTVPSYSLVYAYNAGTNKTVTAIGDGSQWAVTQSSGSITLTRNKWYYYEISYDGSAYNFKISTDGVTYQDDYSYTSSNLWTSLTSFKLGVGRVPADNNSFLGFFDLNAFQIYSNDELVYQPLLRIPYSLTKNGNKVVDSYYRSRVESEYSQLSYTPYYSLQDELGDNYTVVGSPTIADGVVSQFSQNNYLQTLTLSTVINNNTSFDIELEFNSGSYMDTGYSNVLLSFNDTNHGWDHFLAISIGEHKMGYRFNHDSSIFNGLSIEENTDYKVSVNFDSDTKILSSTVNGNKKLTESYTILGEMDVAKIGKVFDDAMDYHLSGSINLNSLKIYVDGKLIYTAGRNYTLPTVEQNDIVEEYQNGVTSYQQRADLFVEQTGTAIEGATVQFPKAFSDTNYALTLPHTNKTTTGFTASVSGDYFAEGGAQGASSSDTTPLEVYEFIIDQSISDPANAVTYVGSNTGFTPAGMDYTNDIFNWGSWGDTFIAKAFRPCMLTYAGVVDYYLDPNDYTKKLDGTVSDVADTSYGGNAMIEFDQIWIKEKNENGKFRISIANSQVDKDYDCWTHMRSDGTLNQYAYRGCYDGSYVTDRVRSMSGLSPVHHAIGGSVNEARVNGAGWNIDEYSQRRLINHLLTLIGKNLNSQAVFGYGRGNEAGQNSRVNSGTLNDKGLFYGVTANKTTAVKVFGIENWWGNIWKDTLGLINDHGTLKYKMCEGTVDGSTVDSYDLDASGYINSGINPTGTTGNVLSTMQLVPHAGLLLKATGETNYIVNYCDAAYIKNDIYAIASFGGGADIPANRGGTYCIALNSSLDNTTIYGCSLTYKAQPSS